MEITRIGRDPAANPQVARLIRGRKRQEFRSTIPAETSLIRALRTGKAR